MNMAIITSYIQHMCIAITASTQNMHHADRCALPTHAAVK